MEPIRRECDSQADPAVMGDADRRQPGLDRASPRVPEPHPGFDWIILIRPISGAQEVAEDLALLGDDHIQEVDHQRVITCLKTEQTDECRVHMERLIAAHQEDRILRAVDQVERASLAVSQPPGEIAQSTQLAKCGRLALNDPGQSRIVTLSHQVARTCPLGLGEVVDRVGGLGADHDQWNLDAALGAPRERLLDVVLGARAPPEDHVECAPLQEIVQPLGTRGHQRPGRQAQLAQTLDQALGLRGLAGQRQEGQRGDR